MEMATACRCSGSVKPGSTALSAGRQRGGDCQDAGVGAERYIERMRARAAGEAPGDGLVSVLGSYLGEAIIAAAGGRWVEDDSGGIGVEDGRIAHFGLGVERPPDAPRHPVKRIDPAGLAAGVSGCWPVAK